MKVLQLSKFYPPVMGGIEAVAWELTEGLNRLGVPPTCCAPATAGAACTRSRQAGYAIVRAGTLGMLLSTSIAPPMPQLLRRMARAADVVHLHMPDPMAAAAVLGRAAPRAALVVHWHSDVIRQRFALRAYEPLQHWLLRRADAIVATSPPYAESSEPLAPWRDKVHVIPIGISDNRLGGLQPEGRRPAPAFRPAAHRLLAGPHDLLQGLRRAHRCREPRCRTIAWC